MNQKEPDDGPMYYDPFAAALAPRVTLVSRTHFDKPLTVTNDQTLVMRDGKAFILDAAGNIIDSAEMYVEYEVDN